jgi:alkylated DNA repair dioxygenase AlkB
MVEIEKEIKLIEKFVDNSDLLFDKLKNTIKWDERMKARKTASFGVAYNYSQIKYPDQEFTEELSSLISLIEKEIGFKPNNCLINFYLDGHSKMGYHSDQTDILEKETGVIIISLGATRILRFRNIKKKELIRDYPLPSGSLIFMSNALQKEWQHSIPKSETQNGRMSLTFRLIK